ncbi:MAG: hypothetical protein ABI168_11345 [Ginsengibacter sp.]
MFQLWIRNRIWNMKKNEPKEYYCSKQHWNLSYENIEYNINTGTEKRCSAEVNPISNFKRNIEKLKDHTSFFIRKASSQIIHFT